MSSVKKDGKSESSGVWLIISVAVIVVAIAGFQIAQVLKQTPQTEPSKAPVIPLSIDGIYKGDLPCADCPGITETLILATDGSYILEDLYQEKSGKPLLTQGKWEILNPKVLKLTPKDNSQSSFFQVLDNGNLQMLDSNMQKIDSPFNQILSKQK